MSLFALSLVSCESTTDYGYYVEQLDDSSVLELFALCDEAVASRNFNAYQSFFAPTYVSIDRSSSDRGYLYRQEYLDAVEHLFDTADSIMINTRVMDIQYAENYAAALVKVQVEEKSIQYGNTRHYSSLADVEVGFEDGWIFINRSTTTTMQVYDE